MKRHFILAIIVATASTACIPDSRYNNMPDSAIYFVDNVWRNGVQNVVMYNVQKTVDVPLHVYCSGFKEKTPEVKAVADWSYIEYYNKVKFTDYKALPDNCWSLSTSDALVDDRRAQLNIRFDVEKTFEFAKSNNIELDELAKYVACVRLESDDIGVAMYKDTASLGYYIATPDLRSAIAHVSSSFNGKDMNITIRLPFENTFDFSYDIEFGCTDNISATFTERGNSIPAKYVFSELPSGTQISNRDVHSMAPGTNKVEYCIEIPNPEWTRGKSANYAFRVSNAILNGEEIEIENPIHVAYFNGVSISRLSHPGENNSLIGTILTEYGFVPLDDKNGGGRTGDRLQNKNPEGGFIFHPMSAVETRPGANWSLAGAFDKNLSKNKTYLANWSTAYPAYYGPATPTLPFWMLVDMQKEFTVEAVEYWTRPDGTVMREIEVYALDDCAYTLNQSAISYRDEDVTYLGNIVFDDEGQNNRTITVVGTTLDPIKTKFLLFNMVKTSNRVDVDCAEMIIYGK